jgi:hypothetical protein
MGRCAHGFEAGTSGEVEMHKTLLDPKLQWKRVSNILYNAQLRTPLYSPIAVLRWIARQFSSKERR